MAFLITSQACALDWDRSWPDGAGDADSARDQATDLGAADARDVSTFDGGVPGEWVTISRGSFVMGSHREEPCRATLFRETQHKVTLTHDFEMMTTEVTQEQYQALMGTQPSYHKSCAKTCPVESVMWSQAADYCNRLSVIAGFPTTCYSCAGGNCNTQPKFAASKIYTCPAYRLPTEAEWEYAYRAGGTTPLHNGKLASAECEQCTSKLSAASIAWFCGNAGKTPHPVGQKQPNAWGLFDMAGNVEEWCHDASTEDLGSAAVVDPSRENSSGGSKVLRGGAYWSKSVELRAAFRHGHSGGQQGDWVGFRCVRSW